MMYRVDIMPRIKTVVLAQMCRFNVGGYNLREIVGKYVHHDVSGPRTRPGSPEPSHMVPPGVIVSFFAGTRWGASAGARVLPNCNWES